MDVRVQGEAEPTPFLRAKAAFETEYDLSDPIKVFVRDELDGRTWTAHYDDHHVLSMSQGAAGSTMARELAIHEFAHMYRHEHGHVSHRQSTAEAIYLSAAGRRVPKARITHCYQIANHMKDIYADDLTVEVTPTEKLVRYLESMIAASVAATGPPAWAVGESAHEQPDAGISAVNAAFALGLVERHDLVEHDHQLYELANVAASDAPWVPFERFRTLFRDLEPDPNESEYRRSLVDATSTYLGSQEQAAD